MREGAGGMTVTLVSFFDCELTVVSSASDAPAMPVSSQPSVRSAKVGKATESIVLSRMGTFLLWQWILHTRKRSNMGCVRTVIIEINNRDNNTCSSTAPAVNTSKVASLTSSLAQNGHHGDENKSSLNNQSGGTGGKCGGVVESA